MLQTDSLIKQYKQSDSVITAVNRASIKIPKGEFAAIIGTSGSGKSTFLHLCAGLDKPDAGSVTINGTEITKLSHDKLGRFRGENMGFVFQRHNLIPQFTALENILIPLKPSTSATVSAICRASFPEVSSSVLRSPVRLSTIPTSSWRTSLPELLTERTPTKFSTFSSRPVRNSV